MSLAAYLVLSGILFAIGAAIVLVRRSAVISLMGVELMLNSANLAFVTFARIHIFKSRVTTNVDDLDLLKN